MLKMKIQLTGNINRSALQIHPALHQLLLGKWRKKKKKRKMTEMCEKSGMRNAAYTSISTKKKNRFNHSVFSLADNIPSPVCVV